MEAIRKALALSLAALLLLSLAASVSAKGKDVKAKGSYKDWNDDLIDKLEILESFNLSSYSKVVILPLDNKKTPLPEKKDNTYEPVTKVLEKVTDIFLEGVKKGLAGKLQVASEKEAPPKESSKGVLLVSGEVVEMNPGSRAARYWVGFGAGKSRVEVRGEVTDAATGAVLLKFTHAKASGVGVAGGDYIKFLTDDTTDVGEDVGKMLAFF